MRVGRRSSRSARRVSDELRHSTAAGVVARRRSALRSLGATAVLGVLSSYQLGLLRHLPDPPLGPFDADLIDGSGEAFWILSAADAPVGMCNFALTAALAGAGGANRAEERPLLVLAWAAKLGLDAGYALLLAVEQPVRYRRLCWYCLTVTSFAVTAVAPAVPEVRAAWRAQRG